MENKKIKIGLIGLGTVGSGVFKTLKAFENIEVTKIAVKNINKPRNIENLDNSILTTDCLEVVNDPEIDIVCELIGGVEPAFSLIKKSNRKRQTYSNRKQRTSCKTWRRTLQLRGRT